MVEFNSANSISITELTNHLICQHRKNYFLQEHTSTIGYRI